jgi:hypothetical protein
MGPLTVLDEVGLDVCGKVAGARVRVRRAGATRADPAHLLSHGARDEGGAGFWMGRGRAKGRTSPIWAYRRSARHRPTKRRRTAVVRHGQRGGALRGGTRGRAPGSRDLATVLGRLSALRGGLLRWVRTVGENETRRRLDALATRHGLRFAARLPGRSVRVG